MILQLTPEIAKNIQLFENLLETGITQVELNYNKDVVEKMLKFRDCNFKIELTRNNRLKWACSDAVNYFSLNKSEWQKMVRLCMFVGYHQLMAIQLVYGKYKKF